ncbi:MAG: hypothetical protein J5606_02405 [Bacteroidales bacterium]|nr:hypothetical protein [Bacteroidales bacterium]
MKSLKIDLFQDKKLDEKLEMSNIIGGRKTNGSDSAYTDTKMQGSWDISLPKYVDVEKTRTLSDKPKVDNIVVADISLFEDTTF